MTYEELSFHFMKGLPVQFQKDVKAVRLLGTDMKVFINMAAEIIDRNPNSNYKKNFIKKNFDDKRKKDLSNVTCY